MSGRTTQDNKEINPTELKHKIDNSEDVFLLDVRTPQEYNSWKLSYNEHENPKLIPVDHLFNNANNLQDEIPKDKEIITICAHGQRSLMAAKLLTKLGYNVKSVKGGMAGWNKVYDISEIPIPDKAPFRIWQIRRVSKGCISYVISSREDNNAIVIDPSREINESFQKLSTDYDLKITKLIDTHQHADNVSGIWELSKLLSTESNNVVVYLSSYEGYELDKNELNYKLMANGDKISVGKNVILNVIHTPGHTKGSMSFFIEHKKNTDSTNNDLHNDNNLSHYLFTGDSLFIDGVGRPDLRDQAEEFAGFLHETYNKIIFKFPENTLILPTHFNVTSISLKHEVPLYDTLGSLRKKINLLSMNKDEFINSITKTIPPKPSNYQIIISINKKMKPSLQAQIPDLEAGPNSCAISLKS
ncbi:MAG: MBL fold metallo-hydrolase [Nitrososphaeraceae archaeon]